MHQQGAVAQGRGEYVASFETLGNGDVGTVGGKKASVGEGDLAAPFDERDEAVTRMIQQAIAKAHAAGIKIGIFGQAPSNYPYFGAFLIRERIEAISLNPDGFAATALS